MGEGNTGGVPAKRSTIPDADPRLSRHRRITYALTTALLTVLVAVLVVDGTGGVDVFGVDSTTATASAEGYTLSVKAASVTRPGLATPFAITVHHPGGFDGPVEVAIDRDYLQHFDFNRFYPEPAAERSSDDLVVLEFDPPDGDELVVGFDGRLEPGAQAGATGWIGVLDGPDVVVSVEVTTAVWP